MKKSSTLDRESFDRLLAWLGADREEGGKRYVEIRERLVRIFELRRNSDPESLADEVINRVAMKIPEMESYEGEPGLYFYAVARKVSMEDLRQSRIEAKMVLPPPNFPADLTLEDEFDCLDSCLDLLPPEDRYLVMEYYQKEKMMKIKHRKKLAEQFGVTSHALTMRVFRIRRVLVECAERCLEKKDAVSRLTNT